MDIIAKEIRTLSIELQMSLGFDQAGHQSISLISYHQLSCEQDEAAFELTYGSTAAKAEFPRHDSKTRSARFAMQIRS